jgi:hypothetical protein
MNRTLLGTQWRRLPHPLRWVGVAAGGGACIVAGLVLLVLPGPGIPLLIVGLVILATEFAWAESLLRRVKKHGTTIASTVSDRLGRKKRSS